ncbi:hypothetical protein RI129_010512 [Pyrocoelia pectoralis]|uniref:NOL1/NOP2/Sun domain family member 4 n=1 Tax=Pyrocoelia pectoralis TaxID=417401 RepID=A0AAN7V4Q8_9COLE
MLKIIYQNKLEKTCYRFFTRNKHKATHWSVIRKKNRPSDKAMEHFDDFYKDVFGSHWLNIRKGLLGVQKYVAVINNYSNTEVSIDALEKDGALNMRTLYTLEKDNITEMLLKKKSLRYLDNLLKQENGEIQHHNPTLPAITPTENKTLSLEASLSTAIIDSSRLVSITDSVSVASLSHFIPTTKIKGMEDFVPESDHYRYFDNGTPLQARVEKEFNLHFPEHLNIYCYEEDNFSTFKSPKRDITDVYNYYIMDGGSVLPVLALDLKPGHRFLDMCAAPGGKSFIALQTLYPNYVVCNDVSISRVNRILSVLEQYFYDLDERWFKQNRIKVTQVDGRSIDKGNFDRILVDVPCTTDRHSLTDNDNNIFKPGRIKERLKLPELQSALLVNALKLVEKGGVVVYSTCSLSPIQNDGVVHMALKQIWEETNREIVIKDLGPALAPFRNVYKFANQKFMKYGHLVIPFVKQNYGPTYFCKLQRIT